MPQKDPSRTEDPTKKRLNQARKEGNVPKSQELSKIIGLLGGIIALRFTFPHIRDRIMETIDWFFNRAFTMPFNEQSIYDLFIFSATVVGKIVLPVMVFILFFTIGIMYLQIGYLWTLKPLKPKLKLFNIISGIKRKFVNIQTIIRLLKNVGQAFAVAIAPYMVLKMEFANLAPLFYESPPAIGSYILNTGFKMVLFALVPLLIIAIADVVYTRWDYNEKLKMTKDEVKDERKQAEGDPKIKRKQRQKMLGVIQKRMMNDIPKADVVITNPTHIAVAIKYDPTVAPAPMVLAKGLNHLAEKIKAVARENNIPIRENKPLAQALYKSVEIGQTIPEDLYKAVAAVLAEIYKIKGR